MAFIKKAGRKWEVRHATRALATAKLAKLHKRNKPKASNRGASAKKRHQKRTRK